MCAPPCSRVARGLLFFLTALSVALFCATTATSGDPFLRTAGNNIRDDRGQGDIVFLRGVNRGGWLLMEGWMSPLDSSELKDDWSVRDVLAKRFGPATRDRLIGTYEETWITESAHG